MDDIVVIILTLIVALFGILNKKRKKNATPGESAPGVGSAPDFWEMLMDDNKDVPGQPQPQVVQEEVKEEEPVQEVRPSFQYSTEARKSASLKRKEEQAKKSKKKSLILGEKFSLKKAVIYSEIINRKYI
ncbi:hypothetical protein [uncultured Draconibacterium sp.]|uniref:hypothetical protein n=1 Tax=uncultured Draconibacterium sp. TaxID=1573823 RepID=UPI0029C9AF0E|nr:hypothetical protein [uncultured Draconibacterium sp.]